LFKGLAYASGLAYAPHTGSVCTDSSSVCIGSCIRQASGRAPDLAPTSLQRYRDIVERQTIPTLGAIPLQKLRPIHIKSWLTELRATPLSPRPVGDAYRCIRQALQSAVNIELISRNPCSPVSPPTAEGGEVHILTPEKIRAVRDALRGSRLYHIVNLALATGMRRGELLALRWSDVGLTKGMVKVERSLEETRAGGLRFKAPKSRAGRRSISIPPNIVDEVRAHRKEQLELRLQLGIGGKPELLFTDLDGDPLSPNYVSIMWRRETSGIVDVKFHALRHTHASALIAAGVDVVTVARRLGHSNPGFTLSAYGHLFEQKTNKAAAAVADLLG